MKRFKFSLQKLFVLVITIVSLNAKAFSQSKDVEAIMKVVELEEQYWNAGDIEGYVSLYAPHDSTRMIYTTGTVYGKDSILAFYKKYWPKEKMGKLKLTMDFLEKVGKDHYYNTGFFEVSYPDKKSIKGRFSGIMKKMNGQWYIYTDHSG